jgi:hypothetical protein
VILRTLAPQDKKAIQSWVEEQTDEDKKELNQWYDGLKSLENGEAWVWHPEKPLIFMKVKFRQRETFHATREFIRSPRASKIVLMDVDEFIRKFKNVFEPKSSAPTEVQVKPKSEVKPEKAERIPVSELIEAFKPVSSPKATQEVEVNQALPIIRVNQCKPVLIVPVEVIDEPTTALGRVVVVLKNDAQNGGRQDKWTGNRIKGHVRDHAWDDNGVEEAIAQLVRWEILRKQSNNYLRFYPQRVEINVKQELQQIV